MNDPTAENIDVLGGLFYSALFCVGCCKKRMDSWYLDSEGNRGNMCSVMDAEKSAEAMGSSEVAGKECSECAMRQKWCEEAVTHPLCTQCCGECQTRNEVESAWICGVWYSSLPSLEGVRNHVVTCLFSQASYAILIL